MSSHGQRRAEDVAPYHGGVVWNVVGADVPGGPRARGCSRARGDVVSLFYSVFLYAEVCQDRASKSSDALLLRCSDAEVSQDRASGFDRPSTSRLISASKSST